MKEIRIAWTPGTHSSREAGLFPREGGDWIADTPQAREDLSTLIECGNQVCGRGTHWLEERQITLGSLVGDLRPAISRAPAADRP
jgi:hypothetical protein